jgi:type IV fimbrial biogenesis protein FimT
MKNAQTGFTLLELLLVVALAGLLLGIGVPAMGNFIRSARITGAANDAMVGLHLARSEAIKRRVPVTFCASANSVSADNPATPVPTCAASVMLTGWIVFVDSLPANNPNGQRDAGEQVLLQHDAIPTTIIGRSATNPASPLRVTYRDNGFADNTNATRLVLCDERGNEMSGGELSAARGILISVTGRAGVTRDPAEIQILIDAIGVPIAGCS